MIIIFTCWCNNEFIFQSRRKGSCINMFTRVVLTWASWITFLVQITTPVWDEKWFFKSKSFKYFTYQILLNFKNSIPSLFHLHSLKEFYLFYFIFHFEVIVFFYNEFNFVIVKCYQCNIPKKVFICIHMHIHMIVFMIQMSSLLSWSKNIILTHHNYNFHSGFLLNEDFTIKTFYFLKIIHNLIYNIIVYFIYTYISVHTDDGVCKCVW